jgi:hypothetical protein
MSEAHQPLASIEFGPNDGFGALGGPDFEDHVERGTGRTAMQWTLQGAHGAGNR